MESIWHHQGVILFCPRLTRTLSVFNTLHITRSKYKTTVKQVCSYWTEWCLDSCFTISVYCPAMAQDNVLFLVFQIKSYLWANSTECVFDGDLNLELAMTSVASSKNVTAFFMFFLCLFFWFWCLKVIFLFPTLVSSSNCNSQYIWLWFNGSNFFFFSQAVRSCHAR